MYLYIRVCVCVCVYERRAIYDVRNSTYAVRPKR